MSETAKRLWLFGVIGVIGLVVAVSAISSADPSPRDFIAKTYSCSPSPADYDSAVCTSPSSVATVTRDITGAVKSIDTHRDASTGKEFLQYGDDIVAVSPEGAGSRIEIDDYDRGYNRHATFVGAFWSSSRPSGSSGGFGGFGGGK